MSNWNDPRTTRSPFGAGPVINGQATNNVVMDQGLRRYMLSIYNYMASGVLLSGIVALLFATSGMAAQVMATPLRWVIALSPLAFVFAMSFGLNRMQESTLKLLFWLFSVSMGLSLSAIFLLNIVRSGIHFYPRGKDTCIEPGPPMLASFPWRLLPPHSFPRPTCPSRLPAPVLAPKAAWMPICAVRVTTGACQFLMAA